MQPPASKHVNFYKNQIKELTMWKGMSIKATWWLWKVTYAWIEEYFRMLCKSIDYIQSNEEIWWEDGRDTYGKEDHTLTIKKVILYGGRDRGVTKYKCSFNPKSYEKITSPWEKS
jgi:hypothetical protein